MTAINRSQAIRESTLLIKNLLKNNMVDPAESGTQNSLSASGGPSEDTWLQFGDTGNVVDSGNNPVAFTGNPFRFTNPAIVWPYSAKFNNDGDSISFTTPANWLGDVTIAMWLYVNGIGVAKGILTLIGAGYQNYNIQINESGYIEVNIGDVALMTTDTLFSVGEWHHLVLTRAGNVWKLYVDGVQEDTVTQAITTAAGNDAFLFMNAAGLTFDGYMADFRVFSAAASQAQIDTLHNPGDRTNTTSEFVATSWPSTIVQYPVITIQQGNYQTEPIGMNTRETIATINFEVTIWTETERQTDQLAGSIISILEQNRNLLRASGLFDLRFDNATDNDVPGKAGLHRKVIELSTIYPSQ